MTDTTALDSFLDKWRARWPEWSVAEVFVPLEQRERTVAWFSLLQEFDDVLNVAGDPLPADAKLGWWINELRDWAGHRSRHPLGRLLEPVPAPWAQLSAALNGLVAARARPANGEAALLALHAYAVAVAAVDDAMFPGGRPLAPEAISTQVLATRLAEAGIGAVPDAFLADSGTAAQERAQRDWAGWLLKAWPRRGGGRQRRILSALARRRLQAYADGQVPRTAQQPLRILWAAWRAARD
ncbi:phytoene/squalene synthase family protein [Xanthomonas sp. XNM01]|uniref:phytoene/squalene synthase family protein n=1 Tax=Xanthomonas sp. XNM01 TaxID=2769289 RepID=UPI00178041E3|nr:phytoene/squalene synthase family protein [Xanthomonas sp. XNM01]MBD9369037.1 phytoene/squalene synthase family protein [Xanthomonas sp. XNM01]